MQYLQMRTRLRQQRPILTELFDLALTELRQLEVTSAVLTRGSREVEAGATWSAIGNANVSPTLRRVEDLVTSRGATDIYAGTVTLVLDDMVQTLLFAYHHTDVGRAGTPGKAITGKYRLSHILRGGQRGQSSWFHIYGVPGIRSRLFTVRIIGSD